MSGGHYSVCGKYSVALLDIGIWPDLMDLADDLQATGFPLPATLTRGVHNKLRFLASIAEETDKAIDGLWLIWKAMDYWQASDYSKEQAVEKIESETLRIITEHIESRALATGPSLWHRFGFPRTTLNGLRQRIRHTSESALSGPERGGTMNKGVSHG